jgi:hypothetical protein
MLMAMKRFVIGGGCLILLLGFGAAACAAQSSITGEWAGGYEIRGYYTPIRMRFSRTAPGLKALWTFRNVE